MTAVSCPLTKKRNRKTQECGDTCRNEDKTAFLDTTLTKWPLLIENMLEKSCKRHWQREGGKK